MKDQELQVLDQYDIEVNSTRKVRGAILCDTKEGLFQLREGSFSEKRMLELDEIYQHLHKKGYDNVDFVIKNKEGNFISQGQDGTLYFLKRWFFGRECDVKKELDLIESANNLALLHHALSDFSSSSMCTKENMEEEMIRHNKELKKIRKFIRDRVGKGEFEHLFLKHFRELYEWAEGSLKMLQKSQYKTLLEKSQSRGMVGHGDYNYHNILMTSAGIATTNFEHCYIGIQVTDLYYFMRKTLEKHHWDIELGQKILERYNCIHPLSKEEMEYIAICLAYPEKFWKAANSYYRSNKSWISGKSIEKLNVAIRQTKEKEAFLEKVFSFCLTKE